MQCLSVRHNDIAGIGIPDHEAVSLFDQVKCDEQTKTGIDTILVELLRLRVLTGDICPPAKVFETASI